MHHFALRYNLKIIIEISSIHRAYVSAFNILQLVLFVSYSWFAFVHLNNHFQIDFNHHRKRLNK